MDWITGFLTVLAMERIRRRYWDGWLLGLVSQAFWAYLIVSRRLWGLAPLCLVLTVQYALALRAWRREEHRRSGRQSQRQEWRA